MTDPQVNDAPPAGIRWYAVVLAVGQLGLLVVGGLSLWRIAGGWWLGAVAAGLFALIFLVGWQVWLAPGSRRRLRFPERLALTLVVGSMICVSAALADLLLPSLVALSVAVLGDALDSRR